MAGRIQGITIEIDGNATGLQKALKGVDGELKKTQSNLRDVNKLLKLDPGNTELLVQKQKNLEKSISTTKKRLDELKKAQSGVDEGSEQWDALQREIIATEQNLKKLEKQYREFGSVSAQQIAAAGQKMVDFGGKVEDAGKKLAPLSGAAGAIGGGLLKLGYDAVQSADDLNTLAKQTGLSTAEIQKMKYASDLVDVSFEDMAGALKKIKPKMKENNKTFADLGVAVTDANGELRDVNDVFNDSLKALSQISNETERDQKAMELFGKSADQLAGIIDDGGAALNAYGKEAEDLGLILGQDTLDALNETNDTLDKMKANMAGSLAQIGADVASVLAPALEKAAVAIGEVTAKLRDLSPEQTETILKIVGVVAAIAPMLIGIGKLTKGIGTVLKLAPKVVAGVKLILAVMSPTTLIIAAIGAAVVALGILIYKNWDKIKAWTKQMVDNIKQKFNELKTNLTTIVNAIKLTVTAAWTGLKSAVVNAVTALKTGVVNAWNNIKASVINTVTTLVSNIKSLFSFNLALPQIQLPSWADIKAKLDDIIQKIKDLFKWDWKLPDIKLPHFKVNGGEPPYGLGGRGSMPSLSIEWYKRAYQNPILFTSPTVLGTSSGYKGFGDGHGAEIVMGLNKLQQLVGASATINVYAAPGQSAKEIAYEVQKVLVQQQIQRSRAYA